MVYSRPTLLLNEKVARNNIEFMSAKLKSKGLKFRPHFKTHQSYEIAYWYSDYGVDAITVSSVDMAKFFANNGWLDIMIAFPVNLLQADEINNLAGKVNLTIILDDLYVLELLDKLVTNNLNCFIKVDTGNHRAGIPAENLEEIESLVNAFGISRHLKFKGFLSHAGQTYHAESKEEILGIHSDNKNKLLNLKQIFSNPDQEIILSTGDTPSAYLAQDFTGLDELRPGVFVFNDLMQKQLLGLNNSQIATVMAVPVVSVYPERNEMLVFGGAVHFSKESIKINGHTVYGELVKLLPDGSWFEIDSETKGYLTSISQEHGVITTNDKFINVIKPGDVVGVIPAHACLAVAQMKYLYCGGMKIVTMNS
ncbi:MAG: alanine racemase [bacterium]